jgi:mannose-6-phosphate isomerase-like protein (cupin superfamily)
MSGELKVSTSGHGYRDKTVMLMKGQSVIVPFGTWHRLDALEDVHLYTIYSPPQDEPGLIEKFPPK